MGVLLLMLALQYGSSLNLFGTTNGMGPIRATISAAKSTAVIGAAVGATMEA